MQNYNPKLIEAYQQNYWNRLKQYAKMSSNKLNFATVYIINQLSTKLEGADTYLKKISETQSSLRYTKILNYPIFSVTERSADIVFDFEGGFKSLDSMLTCRVLPLNVRIGVGDLIVFNKIDKEVLYEAKESSMKQDLMDRSLQISELTLKVKGDDINSMESQVTNVIEYNFEQDLFIDTELLNKYKLMVNLLNPKISEIFVSNYNSNIAILSNTDKTINKLNQEVKNLFSNGAEIISTIYCIENEQSIVENNLTLDLKKDDIVTINFAIENAITIESLIEIVKLLSLEVKLKLNRYNYEMEILWVIINF